VVTTPRRSVPRVLAFVLAAGGAVGLAGLVGVAGCRTEPVPEGIRPEISALPPEMRPPAPSEPARAAGGETWNAAEIDWQPYEAGLARARAQNKPICLVFYTGWCPHCRNYSRVFDDPQVVARARDFVMVRANADDESALAARFAPDGGYVPRTFFLAPDGTMDPEIHAPRPKFLHFFDEHNPRALLAGMDTALRKLVK
jgi:thiol-disulfide isomerase/thioredoxin